MNILQELKKERSKKQNEKIINYIGTQQKYFDELLSYFSQKDATTQDRIAWIMSGCVRNAPKFLNKYYDFIVENLKAPATNGIERNIFRSLQYVEEIPEDYQGEIADLAFQTISSAKSAIANKIFAMTVLHNISKVQPDLQQELAILIEDQLPYGSAGFKNRGGKILKAIRKNMP